MHGKGNMPQSAQNIRESCRVQARPTSFSVLLRRAVQASKLPGVALTLSNSVCQAATAGSTSGAATAHMIALRRAGMSQQHVAQLPRQRGLTTMFQLRSEDLGHLSCSRKALPVTSSAPSSAGGWSAAFAAAGTPVSATPAVVAASATGVGASGCSGSDASAAALGVSLGTCSTSMFSAMLTCSYAVVCPKIAALPAGQKSVAGSTIGAACRGFGFFEPICFAWLCLDPIWNPGRG